MQSGINALIQSFEQDREGTLASIYKTYRSNFLNFSKNLTNDEEMTIDCFQEAVISLYENLTIGKITDQNSTIKTYLFAIGKNKILNAQKKKANQTKLALERTEVEEVQKQKEQLDFNKTLLNKGFDLLGQRCKEVLIRYYYHGYSIEAIMNDMNYKNENTVKAHKSRCLSQIRASLKNVKSL